VTQFKKSLRLALAVVVFGMAFVTGHANASPKSNSVVVRQSECISEKGRLSVLFLVDESKSLMQSDQNAERVNAVKASLQGYYSLAAASLAKGKKKIFIDVKLAGFSDRYEKRSEWVDISNEAGLISEHEFKGLISEVDGFRTRNTIRYTQYDVALSSSLAELKNRNQIDPLERCLVLTWFSDGEHDSDDNPFLSEREQSTIQSDLCGPGKIADQIRSGNVYLSAVGLNKDEKLDLSLMSLISEGQGTYKGEAKTGSAIFQQTSCGVEPATGTYVESKNADELIINMVINIPDSPKDPVALEECGVASADCSEISFTVSGAMQSFKLLINKSTASQRVSLVSPKGTSIDLSNPELVGKNVEVYPYGVKVLWVEVNRNSGAEWDGLWKLSFRGDGSKDSIVSVRFIGDLKVEFDAQDARGRNRIDRDKTKDLRLIVKSVSSSPFVENLDISELSLEISGTPVNLQRDAAPGVFIFPAGKLKDLITGTGAFSSSGALQLSATPIMSVKGLKDLKNQETIQIRFDPTVATLAVSNGDTLPACTLPGTSSIREKQPLTLTLLCDGPKSGDGLLSITEIRQPTDNEVPDLKFKLEVERNCKIPEKSEGIECKVVIAPGEDHNGGVKLKLLGSVSGTKSDFPDAKTDVDYLIAVSMSREMNTEIGWLWFLSLLLTFFVIQALIRLGFAVASSRFEAVEINYRKILIDIRVRRSASGALEITNQDGSRLSASPEQASLMFELGKPTPRFKVGEFSFIASWIETFKNTSVAPLGSVVIDNHLGFGSSSHRANKDGSVRACITLAVPNQWVVAIDSKKFFDFVDQSTSEVDARLIAFLMPLETPGQEIEPQLRELAISIPMSLDDQFRTVAELNARPAEDSGSSDDDSMGEVVESASEEIGGVFQDARPVRLEGIKPTKRSRRSRRNKNGGSEEVVFLSDESDVVGGSSEDDEPFGGAFA